MCILAIIPPFFGIKGRKYIVDKKDMRIRWI